MRDAIGNSISAGNVVLMRSTGLIYRVLRVDEVTLSAPRDDRPPARIVLELDLPVNTEGVRPGQEVTISDLFRIVDPKSELLMEKALLCGDRVRRAREGGAKGAMNPVLLSAKSPHYATPKGLYAELHAEFNFDFDPCPYNEDYSGPLFSFDGLNVSWAGRRVFCNPPYGKAISKFMMKAIEAEVAVFLIPARVDTRWFHELALPHAKEIRFLRGRLKFENCKNPAPFPCMLVIFKFGGNKPVRP